MTARLIDGKALALTVREETRRAAMELLDVAGRPPGLAVVRIGDDEPSRIYVNSKEAVARGLGFHSVQHHLPKETTLAEALGLIDTLNADPTIDGILVQLPLPAHLDAKQVLSRVAPDKDVDGFHPMNAGKLFLGAPTIVPCTPLGVMRMLSSIEFSVAGKVCLVVGRSTIVGRPMAALLLNAHGTVVMAHSRSKLEPEVARADLVVAAAGIPGLIRGAWVKAGAVLIDVGMNRAPDGKLTGDIEFEEARQRASAITPVPGGVGPMTIAMLMHNTVELFRWRVAHA